MWGGGTLQAHHTSGGEGETWLQLLAAVASFSVGCKNQAIIRGRSATALSEQRGAATFLFAAVETRDHVADCFKGNKEALEFAAKAYADGRLVSGIRRDLVEKYGVKIDYKSLSARLQRIAARQATKAAEGPETVLQRAELTGDATAALQGQGAEPLRRRKRLLQRAEMVWKDLSPRAKRSWRFYLALEELALKYLALQFRVAQVTGDGDALNEATETLKIKLQGMMQKVATSTATATATATPELPPAHVAAAKPNGVNGSNGSGRYDA